MKTTIFLTSAAMLLTAVSPSQAAPACAKGKTMRNHEIHLVRATPCEEHKDGTARLAGEELSFRSRGELEMVNPG